MMPPRQAAFRDEYRAQVRRFYNGPAHVFLIYAIGLPTIWYASRHVHSPSWLEWLVVPAVFLLCNLFEWFLHAQVMHRPRKGFMGIYRRHTLAHHQFFTDVEPAYDTMRDFRIVFFPPYALVTFIAMSAVGAAILSLLWSAN